MSVTVVTRSCSSCEAEKARQSPQTEQNLTSSSRFLFGKLSTHRALAVLASHDDLGKLSASCPEATFERSTVLRDANIDPLNEHFQRIGRRKLFLFELVGRGTLIQRPLTRKKLTRSLSLQHVPKPSDTHDPGGGASVKADPLFTVHGRSLCTTTTRQLTCNPRKAQ